MSERIRDAGYLASRAVGRLPSSSVVCASFIRHLAVPASVRVKVGVMTWNADLQNLWRAWGVICWRQLSLHELTWKVKIHRSVIKKQKVYLPVRQSALFLFSPFPLSLSHPPIHLPKLQTLIHHCNFPIAQSIINISPVFINRCSKLLDDKFK